MIGGGGGVGGGGVLSLSFSFPSALCDALSGPAVLQNDDARSARSEGDKREEREEESRGWRQQSKTEREIDRLLWVGRQMILGMLKSL